MKIAALKIKTIILIGEVKDMRLRKRVKVLEGKVADFENLLKPVLEAFEKMENSASTEKENKNELDYKGVIDEWLNGSANGTNK